MSNISTYLADALLNHAFGEAAYTEPTAYLGLFTTNPTMPGGTGGVEVSGGSYARQSLSGSMPAAAGGSISINQNVSFPQATASWGTVVGVGIWDSNSGGNLLWAGGLSQSMSIGSGATFYFPSSDLTATLS